MNVLGLARKSISRRRRRTIPTLNGGFEKTIILATDYPRASGTASSMRHPDTGEFLPLGQTPSRVARVRKPTKGPADSSGAAEEDALNAEPTGSLEEV